VAKQWFASQEGLSSIELLSLGSLYYFSYIILFSINLVNMSIFQIHEVHHSSANVILPLIY
jgi:hypothetical protein